MLRRGEQVVRIAPKLAAGARNSARERGKSDVIDAVSIARAALREGLDTLPIARLAGPELDVRLLVDHRERLVAQRTQLINDLRWHLHDLWPELEIPARVLITARWQERINGRLARAEQDRAGADRPRRAATHPRAHEIDRRVAARTHRPRHDLGTTTARRARLRRPDGRQADRRDRRLQRFATDAKLARLAGSAPIPASSGNTTRHRLDRGGNRQLNCALHRLAVTKGRLDPDTAAYLARKQAEGKSRREALRCLKRHLARRIWRLLQPPTDPIDAAASPIPRPPTRAITIHCNTPYSRFSLT